MRAEQCVFVDFSVEDHWFALQQLRNRISCKIAVKKVRVTIQNGNTEIHEFLKFIKDLITFGILEFNGYFPGLMESYNFIIRTEAFEIKFHERSKLALIIS